MMYNMDQLTSGNHKEDTELTRKASQLADLVKTSE